MTKHGYNTPRSSFYRRRSNRVSVLISRPCGCVGLYRDDDTVWTRSHRHSTNSALVLNILVEFIGTYQFWRAGHFSWKLFWPFALLSVPAAYVGGYLQPSASVLRILIGVVLLFAAARLLFRRSDPPQTEPPSQPVAISVGAGLGFLSGLTGTGGGIFLTPLLLFCKWAHIRQAAAVSALFIWVNSIAGLVGYFTKVRSIPSLGLTLATAAIIGGIVGSKLGSRHFAVRVISFLLATVLLIAGIKLIFTR